MSDAGRIPTVLCIDVEPDDTPPRRADRWPGFESMLTYTDELRDRLSEVTAAPVRFTWALRMDPQIELLHGSPTWFADRYAAELDRLRAAGDSFGAHTHAWRLPDTANPDGWVADWSDPVWVAECVEMTLSSFAAAMGQPCEVHRFGDRFISSGLHALLGEHGVKVDLTVEPGARSVAALYRGWVGTRRTLDYARAPRAPYLPDAADPLRVSADADASGPWLVPLTALDASDLLPAWRRVAREIRYPRRVRHRPVVLWAPGSPEALWAALERDAAGAERPYLAFAIRTNALLEPWSAVPLRAKMDALLRSSIVRRLLVTDALSVVAAVAEAAAPAASTRPANAQSGV